MVICVRNGLISGGDFVCRGSYLKSMPIKMIEKEVVEWAGFGS